MQCLFIWCAPLCSNITCTNLAPRAHLPLPLSLLSYLYLQVQGTGRVASAREHSAWVVAAHFRPDIPEVITGSVRGSVKFWDLRTMRSYKTLEVHKSPLTALAVHSCAPVMATGSHAQFIKILGLNGDQLGGIIKYVLLL